MDISKYADYFHDGKIYDMKHSKDNIVLSLESAELLPEWNEDNLILSKFNAIAGNLHLEGVKKIYINDKISHTKFEMIYDVGEVYDLEVGKTKILLEAIWRNDPPKLPEETDLFIYKIEAENIYWENIPTAYDVFWDSLGRKTD